MFCLRGCDVAFDNLHATACALGLQRCEVRVSLVDDDRLPLVAGEVDFLRPVANLHLAQRLRAVRLRPAEICDAVVAEHVRAAAERARLARLHALPDEALEPLRAAAHRIEPVELARRASRRCNTAGGCVNRATGVLHGVCCGGHVAFRVLHNGIFLSPMARLAARSFQHIGRLLD